MLVGPRAVVDHRPGEIIIPRNHHVEQKRLLHVDEHRELVAGNRHFLMRQPVHFPGDLVHGEDAVILSVLRQRIVLILRLERRLVLQLQIHGVLKRRNLVVVVSGIPAHHRTLNHFGAVRPVEFGGGGEVPVRPESFRADVGIFFPELHILRKLIYHLGPLSVPVGMCVPVQYNVRHISETDDRARHDS